MAKVEANKVLIKPEPVSAFVPTPSYRRVPAKAEAYADTPPSSSNENLKLEIENILVHEVARTLYGSSILPQSIEVYSLKYEVNFKLNQGHKANINISAWRQGKKFAEVSLH